MENGKWTVENAEVRCYYNYIISFSIFNFPLSL